MGTNRSLPSARKQKRPVQRKVRCISTVIVSDEKLDNNSGQSGSQDGLPLEEVTAVDQTKADLSTAEGNPPQEKQEESRKEIQPLLVDIVRAAQLTGISKSTINPGIRMNPPAFPSVKVAGMRLFAFEELAEWYRRLLAERPAGSR